ncbi:Alpha/beta hydrolase family protein [Palleronia salina]|uniref:Alpha/beta hydrolase family protein n=1 Tax=Palleronia salina TaxID=313368 RepID=A0A1M6J8L7_9RHOB|nr:alpha/beta hydrolase [Palleronia salina]SHJ43014.1 Alpha/beta hydrolase family protein [Palleronia salina]
MTNDDAYDNSGHIPDAEAYPPRWAAEAEAFRLALGARALVNFSYGDNTRQVFDLFMPEDPPKGCIVFVHGGYWRRFDPRTWSAFASGGLDAGWAVAMPGYTLAPEARISQITREIAQALGVIGDAVPGPLRLVGHSAGGHLVSRMLCGDAMLPSAIADRIEGCVPISPVSDLRPLIDTTMNDDLGLTEREAHGESPALLSRGLDVPMTVWVGGDERPAFLDQARWLAAAWGVGLHVDEGRHHFDVIDGLRDAESPLMRAVLGDTPAG